jgi:hypothetical protein
MLVLSLSSDELMHANTTQVSKPPLILTLKLLDSAGAKSACRCLCSCPQRKVLEQFHAMRASSWRMIDATQSVEAIQQQLREQAAAVIKRCQSGAAPIGQLWGGARAPGVAPLTELNR